MNQSDKDREDLQELQRKAESCYGCHNYPEGDYKLCDEFHNIKKMQKINSPCYNDNIHAMNNVNAHEEYGNIETLSL